MKKTIAILLLLCLCIGLCACGDQKNWDPIAEATATLNELYNCKTEEDLKKVMHKETSKEDLYVMLQEISRLQHYAESISVKEVKHLETVNGYNVFLFELAYDATQMPMISVPLVGTMGWGSASIHSEESGISPIPEPLTDNGMCYLTEEDGRYVIALRYALASMYVTDLLNEEFSYIDCDNCSMGKREEPGTIDCENCNQGWVLDTEHDAANCEDCQYYSESGTEVYRWLECDECRGFGTVDTVFVDCEECNGMGAVTLESLKIQ